MRKIITQTGEIVPLAVWQQKQGFEKGFDRSKLSEYFSTKERSFNKPTWLLHETLFHILDALRETVNKPIRINSAYRTQAEQMALRKVNEGAVLNSPHTWGLAVDIDTESDEETDLYVKFLKEIADRKGLEIRLGYEQYKKTSMTFVHLDVCPEIFGIGKAWELLPNVPNLFRKSIEW